MVGIAFVDLVVGSSFFTDERTAHLVAAEAALGRVLSLAPNHAFAHLALGGVLMCSCRAAQGLAECERALALDRNIAEAHALIGWAKYFMGRGAETETHISEAFRLSPRDILSFQWSMMVGFAKLQVSADDEALSWFRRSIETNRNHPTSHFGLAAALALLGKQEEAWAAVQAGLALNPTFAIKRFKSFSVSDNPAFLAGAKRAVKGFHLAGVPKE
ncbi:MULTISPECIES: tetratricopeptide repeat protein [Bradyrhizobium]|uniref:tetratricopeptide repeat protein n=1 Tax=Bradyrhizobium TaxID=374 RepID=UPI000F530D17|nr:MULTISPECIES: tetratricopeptide repeat protein [Bradyrhizobium]RQH05873.1 tetratricopeptide repeat protein [Bradyrhizobium sp. RP6]UWU93448.1 tetratricopeptide repeat protein [Bradyrhizobium sp. CB1015]